MSKFTLVTLVVIALVGSAVQANQIILNVQEGRNSYDANSTALGSYNESV